MGKRMVETLAMWEDENVLLKEQQPEILRPTGCFCGARDHDITQSVEEHNSTIPKTTVQPLDSSMQLCRLCCSPGAADAGVNSVRIAKQRSDLLHRLAGTCVSSCGRAYTRDITVALGQ